MDRSYFLFVRGKVDLGMINLFYSFEPKQIVSLFLVLTMLSCSFKKKIDLNDNSKKDHLMKIGFGSCLKQDKPMPVFQSIKADNFDLFLMIGDNVYGDTQREDLRELKLAYKQQRQNFDMMELDFPFEAIWDDHDYGLNDAGKEYPFKDSSKELFLNFWNIPLDDSRRSQEGLYHDLVLNIGEKKLQIIFLDTRTFRDELIPTDEIGKAGKERYIPDEDSSSTILGNNQWTWLREKISLQADFRIIVSSIQFLALGHGWESWNNFPHERKRLINSINNSNLNHILIISGDRHRGGLYQLKTNKGKIISEMTSSSLNASFPNSEELGPLRIGSSFVEENYGSISINSLENTLSVFLKDIRGETLQSLLIEN